MSRVFEALNKATGERKSSALESNNAIVHSRVGEKLSDSALGSDRLSPGVNGHAVELPYLARPVTSEPKSWRERLEEWFFGWDLRRYNNYPIVALEKDSPASEQYKILREQIKRPRAVPRIRT